MSKIYGNLDMDKDFKVFLNTQRKLFLFSSLHREVLHTARLPVSELRHPKISSQTYFGKSKFAYICESCSFGFRKEDVEVDHVKAIRPKKCKSFDEIVKRMFCPVSELQVLCQACHRDKTNEDLKSDSENSGTIGFVEL